MQSTASSTTRWEFLLLHQLQYKCNGSTKPVLVTSIKYFIGIPVLVLLIMNSAIPFIWKFAMYNLFLKCYHPLIVLILGCSLIYMYVYVDLQLTNEKNINTNNAACIVLLKCLNLDPTNFRLTKASRIWVCRRLVTFLWMIQIILFGIFMNPSLQAIL